MEDFNEGVDAKLASRMRSVNPEQFHTLVKMHLSFELELNTETDNECVAEKAKLKKWGLPTFSRKPKSTMNLQKGTDNAILTDGGIMQVKKLIEYLSHEQCLVQEGIFRRTGKLTRQQDLKIALQKNLTLNFEDGRFSVHDCASVLKGFLAELPEPLLTELHYPVHCQIAELCSSSANLNEGRLLSALQLLLLLLPIQNRILLKHVLHLLNRAATFEHSNKMNSKTLATLFTPHLMCPRKLSPEALHMDSQNLSGLVAFMIERGTLLFQVPLKLATDIRAYWVEQERKLLSPKKMQDLNESISDTTGGTAKTVFSFVDHKLTAKANSTQDTEAALAQLYAHIQAMPESAKKRRLVKQFNKENGQGTPRQVKQYSSKTKSLGDSIKKHIFQKKLLGNKKFVDINFGCSISRSSSEENILAKTQGSSKTVKTEILSKSDDELSNDSYDNLLPLKRVCNSTGSLLETSTSFNAEKKLLFTSVTSIDSALDKEEEEENNKGEPKILIDLRSSLVEFEEKRKEIESNECKLSRHLSEPSDIYSTSMKESRERISLIRQHSDSAICRKLNIQLIYTPSSYEDNKLEKIAEEMHNKTAEASKENLVLRESFRSISPPVPKNRLWNIYNTHTSTPSSNLLRRSFANSDYTPIINDSDDKSMSPITQSATKMTKAMQETMMTPRSRKPVMMISGSNLCDLASNNWKQTSDTKSKDKPYSNSSNIAYHVGNKENHFVISTEDEVPVTTPTTATSITSTFREYLLSRSVLTASPVDLSFTSRTDDFEQSSESDLNILNEDGLSESLLHCLNGNNPDASNVSGTHDSMEKVNEELTKVASPRKRGGSTLQRNLSNKSMRKHLENGDLIEKSTRSNQSTLKHKQLSESTLKSVSLNTETFQETSF